MDIHASIVSFMSSKMVFLVMLILMFVHMIVTKWLPTAYLHIYTLLYVRLILAIVVVYLVYIIPYYGILITSVLIVILNEYYSRKSDNMADADDAPVPTGGKGHTRSKYSNYSYAEGPYYQSPPHGHDINARVNTPLATEPDNVNMLINQHNLQVTDVMGGLHGIFVQDSMNPTYLSEDNDVDVAHPANATLTQNLEGAYQGAIPYVSEYDLWNIQNNTVPPLHSGTSVSSLELPFITQDVQLAA
jgi:hypothetical protein